jgi:hypothetical protein
LRGELQGDREHDLVGGEREEQGVDLVDLYAVHRLVEAEIVELADPAAEQVERQQARQLVAVQLVVAFQPSTSGPGTSRPRPRPSVRIRSAGTPAARR